MKITVFPCLTVQRLAKVFITFEPFHSLSCKKKEKTVKDGHGFLQ